MFRKVVCFLCFLVFSLAHAQEKETLYFVKKIVPKDTIRLDSVSINKEFFKLQDRNGTDIDTSLYKINFSKALLVFNKNYSATDSLTVRYLKLPDFLTREYTIYDKSRVVENSSGIGTLYRTDQDIRKKFIPFEGLSTSGSITRGVSLGNNQNTSLNSNLDLQITGKLSEKVSLRASLQDTNIPLQQGGYSQKLDEFDQIFIELFSQNWSVRAGDLFLENRKSRFLNFNKKVQGVSSQFTLGNADKKTEIYAAGAVVRGQYAKSTFVGQEGNQGPYKLKGPNGELYVLVISGSERVYVNGILLKRGESNQYVIDYNAGEVTFTSLFPITSEMRISIEYQYSDRNFTRLVTYGGVMHEQEKWQLGGFVYSENDVKNQPLQQNLSPEQVQILANAGDNQEAMTAPSAVEDTFADNKILYKKTLIGSTEVFVYSNNPADVLYTVKFSFVGTNQGNYKISNASANGKIYEYVAPISGVPQGSFEPKIRLIAPAKIQIATLMGKFTPSEKTNLAFEVGLSNSDKNLYSTLDDTDNKGISTKIDLKKRLYTGVWKIDALANYQLVQQNFKTLERLFTIEFDRDWNLNNPQGNQSLLSTGVQFALEEKSNWKYQWDKLNFSQNFKGDKHSVSGFYKNKNISLTQNGSLMTAESTLATSHFLRNQTLVKYQFSKNWIGSSLRHENNAEKNKESNLLTNTSQRFTEWGAFAGRGDSTKVFTEIGYLNRVNDSLKSGFLERVNTSQSYYIKSRILHTDQQDLSIFANYRNLRFKDARGNEPSLNSRITYSDQYWKQFIQNNIAFETTSGTIAQQEFSFLEVEPGKGIYAWNDYNQNGIQELQEFEIAPFPDQAKYIKIFLPNQIFIKTHQNKFSESLILNPSVWQNKSKFAGFISHFYNQSSYFVERKIKRLGDQFDFNPFSKENENLLGLNSNFKNTFYFNRGKQFHSVTYSYNVANAKNLLSSGSQENNSRFHQLQYSHLYHKYWLLGVSGKLMENKVNAENYLDKNFTIEGYQLNPKITYLFSKNTSLELFYEYQNKTNTIGKLEELVQNKAGVLFNFIGIQKITLNGEVAYINNQFSGNEFSPVGFQMLEGLQAGKNVTWRLLFQKSLTQYLDLSLNYQGRKTETSNTIHNGSVQLRAYF